MTRTVHGSLRDARKELARLEEEVRRGIYCDAGKLTVGDLMDRYLADRRGNLKETTAERYEDLARLHIKPHIGTIRLASLEPIHISSLYLKLRSGDRPLAARTVHHVHQLLHSALRQAVKWRLIARDPTDAVDAPKAPHREMMSLDAAQTQSLLMQVTVEPSLVVPVALAVGCGMRRGEILGLQWGDIEWDHRVLHVRRALHRTKEAGVHFSSPKTHRSSRVVKIPHFVLNLLRDHKRQQAADRLQTIGWQDNDLVCPAGDGTPWNPNAFNARWNKFRKAANLTVRFHDLRHTHATLLIQQGADIRTVSERLGHGGVAITLQFYAHVLEGMQDHAADLMDKVVNGC